MFGHRESGTGEARSSQPSLAPSQQRGRERQAGPARLASPPYLEVEGPEEDFQLRVQSPAASIDRGFQDLAQALFKGAWEEVTPALLETAHHALIPHPGGAPAPAAHLIGFPGEAGELGSSQLLNQTFPLPALIYSRT